MMLRSSVSRIALIPYFPASAAASLLPDANIAVESISRRSPSSPIAVAEIRSVSAGYPVDEERM